MVNSIICYYINHCHQLIVSIIFKISYRLILLPCLINLICCSIDKIKCSSKPGKRLNQPFLPIEGDSGSGQHFLWAIVIVATILLVFLSICFCRCYYRYNEICDEKHSQFDYPFDHHLYAGSSACQTPTPSTSPITVPQSIQLASSNVSQHQIKIYAHANERCKDKNEQEQSQQLSTIVLHGQSSIKIHANPAKHDSKTRRQSSFRSSL